MKNIVFIVFYLGILLILISGAIILNLGDFFPSYISSNAIYFYCIISGGYGGILYCLRGLYLNYCLEDNWNRKWEIWYYIRPIVSMISGGFSSIFLKTSLLILQAEIQIGTTNFGFIAIAFIAGLNVDKFLKRIENLAQTSWGIEKSRASKTNSN